MAGRWFALSFSSLLLLGALLSGALAVDRSKFRTCDDTSFCKKFRHFEDEPKNAFALIGDSVKFESDHVFGKIHRVNEADTSSSALNFRVFFTATGVVRVKISEDVVRWQPADILQAEGLRSGAYTHIRPDTPEVALLPAALRSSVASGAYIALHVGGSTTDSKKVLVVHTSPLRVELFDNGVLVVVANERNLLHFEKTQSPAMLNLNNDDNGDRAKEAAAAAAAAAAPAPVVDKHAGKEIVDYGEDGLAIYADGTKEVEDSLEDDDEIDIDGDGEGAGGARHLQDVNNGAVHGKRWEERFHSHVDKRPHGPMSVGMDIAFPFSPTVYGIPEHAAPLSLPPSLGTAASGNGNGKAYNQPYRMYNLDVFEYELDNTMALYGNIPFLLAQNTASITPADGSAAQSATVSAALFWFNPSEAFIDVKDATTSTGGVYKQTHWMCESGLVDFFLFSDVSIQQPSAAAGAGAHTPAAYSAVAPTATKHGFAKIYHDYSLLTGFTALPPLFSLGYHQCRWNYRDEKDVAAVEGKFEELDFPVDVIWLDIEHTDGKRYFTWDKTLFPTPKDMIDAVAAHGRRMVTIVDPHIKRDNNFPVHAEATSKGHYIKNHGGVGDFDGWCWPGSSSYLDFTSPAVRQWWGERFAYDKYIGSTPDLYTWNDMNEPSVFNGPEVSMPKDAESISGVEHREWHNLYGLYFQQATAQGLTMRDEKKLERPFVLSRAFWASTQKYGAIWTGDNTAAWGHLEVASPMLLSISVAGLSFAGADIGGFFGNPDAELLTRWYQAAAFTPFFRNHAHLDSKRREPWVHGEPTTSILRTATMIRYALLPYWYTLFFESHMTGMPVLRPLFMEFPQDRMTAAIDNAWMVGGSLLIKPITEPNKRTMDVYLPPALWYDFFTYQAFNTITPSSPNVGRSAMISNINMHTIPVFIRGGSILARKMRLRRSSKLMFFDPFTLTIAPDAASSAHGTVYLDDEHTFLYKSDPAGGTNTGGGGAHSVNPQHAAYFGLEYDAGSHEIRSRNLLAASETAVASSTGAGSGAGAYVAPNTVERVELLSQARPPMSVTLVATAAAFHGRDSAQATAAISADDAGATLTSGTAAGGAVTQDELPFSYDAGRKLVTIKVKPQVILTSDWRIVLKY